MRSLDSVILKAKLQEFIIESKKNIDSKIQKINSFLFLMKEENEFIVSKSNQKISLYNWILLIVIEYYESNNIKLNIPGFEKKSKLFSLSSNKNNNYNNIKKSQFDLLLNKEREKIFFNNNKTLNIEDNNTENRSNNSVKNIKNKDIDYSNMLKLKLVEDNTTSRISNNEYNFKKYNKQLSANNMALIGLPKKHAKLVFMDRNKNIGLIKDKKFNLKKRIESNDIREIFIRKINQNYIKTNHNRIRNLNNINAQKNVKKIMSVETNHKQNSQQIKNIHENYSSMNLEQNRNLINKRKDKNIIKEYISKSTDEINNLNNNKNKIKINGNLKGNNNHKNAIDKDISDIITKINNINNDIKLKSLTNKENSCLVLSQSKILNLRERIIFSRASKKVSSLISIKDILKSNKLFIKDKIKELEGKIDNYNVIIRTHFTPSKTAIISLNIIKKEDEDNFKNFLKNNDIVEKEKDYYYKYIEILYILLDDNTNENNSEKININVLYNKLKEKKYNSCKDFLYEIFILQQSDKNYNEQKMDKFSKEFGKLPDFIKHNENIKNNRFICFSYFLLNEIYIYWNKIKQFLSLKNKTQYYIDCLKKKI